MGIIFSYYPEVLIRKKTDLEPILGSNSFTVLGSKLNLGSDSYTGPVLDLYRSRPLDMGPSMRVFNAINCSLKSTSIGYFYI